MPITIDENDVIQSNSNASTIPDGRASPTLPGSQGISTSRSPNSSTCVSNPPLGSSASISPTGNSSHTLPGSGASPTLETASSSSSISPTPTGNSSSSGSGSLPVTFKVLPLRQVVKGKIAAKRIYSSVRKAVVADNCNSVWQHTQTLTSEGRRKMAMMIIKEYPFLKQPNDPPEV